jgi:tetratricopeptide (TPR) repeat protein
VRSREPIPPRRVKPGVPRDVETICLKCLKKETEQRYASAGDLADDLRRFLEGRPILARRTPPWERAWKWARRRPLLAMLIVGLALAGMLTTGFTLQYREQQAARRERFHRLLADGKLAEADGRLALAHGRDDEAVRQFAEALQCFHGALGTLDSGERIQRAQVEQRRDQVARYLHEQDLRRQVREQVRAFRKDHHEVLFHAISLTGAAQAGNREQVLRLAPAALRRFGVTVEPSANERSAGLRDPDAFASPEQLARVAQDCYEILLVWADAVLPADTAKADHGDGARQALRLLESAQALTRAHHLEVPRAFYLRRARDRELSGDLRGAEADRAQARAMKPRTALDHFLEAMEAWQLGKTAAAARACEEVLLRQPDHFWALYLQGLCSLRQGRPDAASAYFTGCLGRRPDFVWARLLRATARTEMPEAEWPAAEKDFALVLRHANDPLLRAVALINRGTLRLRQKRSDDALTDLREAMRLRPDAIEAHVNLARVHELRQELASALQVLDQALKHRQIANLYFARARIHLARNDAPAARSDFEKGLGLEKNLHAELRLSALVELGYLKHRAGEHQAALADFDEALRRRPDYAPAHLQRAKVLLALERHAEAGAALDRYLHGGNRVAEVHLIRGLIHVKLGDHAAAIDEFTTALQGKPDVVVLGHRGWAYLRMNAIRLALADFNAALRLGPASYQVLCGRGLALLGQGAIESALRDAEAAVRLDGGAEASLLAACVHARAVSLPRTRNDRLTGEHCKERAVELLAQALRGVPADRRAVFWQTRVHKEESLAAIRDSARYRQMERTYNR